MVLYNCSVRFTLTFVQFSIESVIDEDSQFHECGIYEYYFLSAPSACLTPLQVILD